MTRTAIRLLTLLVGLALLTGLSFGQVVPGTPPFGSFGGGPFDTVNLGNLNAHFVVPVLNKAGRGMPFTYNLAYDTSVWYPVNVSGSTTWKMVPNAGWTVETQAATGYVSYVGWHTFRHTVGTMLAEMGEHQLMIRDYLRHSDLHVTNKYLQATTKSKRLAQGKLVDAILPGGVLSGSKSNLIH
jgi:hypothetical protein